MDERLVLCNMIIDFRAKTGPSPDEIARFMAHRALTQMDGGNKRLGCRLRAHRRSRGLRHRASAADLRRSPAAFSQDRRGDLQYLHGWTHRDFASLPDGGKNSQNRIGNGQSRLARGKASAAVEYQVAARVPAATRACYARGKCHLCEPQFQGRFGGGASLLDSSATVVASAIAGA
jgi:hypothetical protein